MSHVLVKLANGDWLAGARFAANACLNVQALSGELEWRTTLAGRQIGKLNHVLVRVCCCHLSVLKLTVGCIQWMFREQCYASDIEHNYVEWLRFHPLDKRTFQNKYKSLHILEEKHPKWNKYTNLNLDKKNRRILIWKIILHIIENGSVF
jgi:hypothetical protein